MSYQCYLSVNMYTHFSIVLHLIVILVISFLVSSVYYPCVSIGKLYVYYAFALKSYFHKNTVCVVFFFNRILRKKNTQSDDGLNGNKMNQSDQMDRVHFCVV